MRDESSNLDFLIMFGYGRGRSIVLMLEVLLKFGARY
jgi:hypothetical protein